jgi:hypothetical protein
MWSHNLVQFASLVSCGAYGGPTVNLCLQSAWSRQNRSLQVLNCTCRGSIRRKNWRKSRRTGWECGMWDRKGAEDRY